jgi:hypothetical protein
MFGVMLIAPMQCLFVVGVSTRGVPGPTSKFVAACPSPDGLARDRTQRGKMRLVLSRAQGGVLVVGVTSGREREREIEPVRQLVLPRATLSREGLGPSFYRCKERVHVYNGGVARRYRVWQRGA